MEEKIGFFGRKIGLKVPGVEHTELTANPPIFIGGGENSKGESTGGWIGGIARTR